MSSLTLFTLVSRYVPTIVVDGEVYVGALDKLTYKGLIERWLVG